MARITYNNKSIDLKIGPDGLETEYAQERTQNISGTGLIEQINQYGSQILYFDAYFNESTYRDLVAWWAWARQGKTWAFAFDETKTASTTLDGPANSGKLYIPLSSTTGFQIGDVCILCAQDADDQFEVVVINALNPGVGIAASKNLVYSYSSGATFLHIGCFPLVVSLDDNFSPSRSGTFYRHTFKFIAQ